MRYAGIIPNDLAAAPGVCVSVFTQGCPLRCLGCHNPETWSFSGGKEVSGDTINRVITLLQANNVHRNLCIMGGEPLCPENQEFVKLLCQTVKSQLPNTKIYIWTGYTLEDLLVKFPDTIPPILDMTTAIVDGPYIAELRDITLHMRGSSNQRILYKGVDY